MLLRLAGVLFISVGLYAQSPDISAAAPAVPSAAQAGPNFNAEAATRAYLDTLGTERKAHSDSYFEGGYWLILWDFLYGVAISLILLATKLSAKMRDRAEKITKHPPLIIFLYWVQYLIAASILGAPLAIYEGFLREKQYQLMNQTFSAWVVDQLKELAVSAVLGGLAMMLLIGIVRRLPRTWHIWGAVAATVFVIIGALITPVFISPLFNKYQRLGAGPVRDSILRLARQNGIPANDVYEVDASRQSNRISANVSGFLGTERITLNDNLLKRCSSTCVEAVMGHEMGHYVLNHIYKMILYFGVVFAVFFTVLRRLLHWAFDRWGATWELRDVSDPAVLPLAALILSSLFFVFTPINNTWIRTQEYEADIFGLNTSRQPDGFAEAALLLSEYRKLEPGPVEEFLFFDHPSGRTRISSAMRWKAENQPQP